MDILRDFSRRYGNMFRDYRFVDGMDEGVTLVSKDGIFELGFFSPGSSGTRYLGIWCKKIPVRTVVWVANRSNPINDSTCLLMIDSTSKNLVLDSTSKNLVLINSNNGVVWSSSNSTKEAQNPVVQLLDSGNLVLRDGNNGNSGIYLWQSFDYPTDTLLAGMKIGEIGEKLKPQHSMRLVSWKNWDDPSPGDFVWDLGVVHDIVESAIKKGSSILFRSGPWNGVTFSGLPQFTPSQVYDPKFARNEEEVYYLFYQRDTVLLDISAVNSKID
ncbi:S-locus-specific glycoprotein S13-like [Jatropha curcas]|uniref:S-locus-specific glycoprotein S13-like n=1 Tax=Jatropha curcas TaxID=180498 RepID=UPI0018932836|nr:S-locus-specific glycoprotein S13-like [Jatropha curcas]